MPKCNLISGYEYLKEEGKFNIEVFIEYDTFKNAYKLLNNHTNSKRNKKLINHYFGLPDMLYSKFNMDSTAKKLIDNNLTKLKIKEHKLGKTKFEIVTFDKLLDVKAENENYLTNDVFGSINECHINEKSILQKFNISLNNFRINSETDEILFDFNVDGISLYYYNTLTKAYYLVNDVKESDLFDESTKVIQEVTKGNLGEFLDKALNDIQLRLIQLNPPVN